MLDADARLPLLPFALTERGQSSYWDERAAETDGSKLRREFDAYREQMREYERLSRQRLTDVLRAHAQAINANPASIYDDPLYWMEN